MHDLFPGTVPVHGDRAGLEPHQRARLPTAALLARRVHPGELASRELIALADPGMRFEPDALIPRLATAILGMPTATADAAELSR